ncbi:MAG TPA: tetratricopeptide repeat protein [Terriglobales bacterium]|nr:tetratricopeptide repeat protein [Terriglobales bacterium]
MDRKLWLAAVAMGLTFSMGSQAHAGDLKITLPKRSISTPVQRLNQKGVEAVRSHNYGKAEALFYKAYLLDPDDPFTLNNLGYVSEMQGQVDRAQEFYAQAGKQPTDAVIYRASSDRQNGKKVENRSVNEALNISPQSLQVNHDNVEAVRLLSQGRASEVDLLLQQTLKTDPHNIFTLNNMGVAKELEGESDDALKYYAAAAADHSDAAALVTVNSAWRGKPVSEMAAQNARSLRNRLESRNGPDVKLAEFNLRGVSAVNRNDLTTAQQDFRAAYALDPNNAFAINNIGYLSEMQGDQETAEFFYDRAKIGTGANASVGLATRRAAEGSKLLQVASANDAKVQAKTVEERNMRRQRNEPIVLRHRDNTLVVEPTATPAAPPAQ